MCIRDRPQIDQHGSVCGAEALLRWRYNDRPLPPPLVIQLAQEDHIYDELTVCIPVSYTHLDVYKRQVRWLVL